LLLQCLLAANAFGQEVVAPLRYNAAVGSAAAKQQVSLGGGQLKTTAITLPFFEDFTGVFPNTDTTKWVDNFVYINNTMGVDPISRGVATFDGLSDNGLPYDEKNSSTLLVADNLTSVEIDLSGNTPADSIYLSFFYQPQGNGFYPETEDSLLLFFKMGHSRGWTKVWEKEGSKVQPFKQVMVAVVDTSFFHSGFQFRFLNKASLNTNDDVWNLDYIRMAAGRNIYDTAVNDVAFTSNPTFMLNDYTYMPYSHFMQDPGSERSIQNQVQIRNNNLNAENVTYTLTARETQTNTPLFNSGQGNINVPPATQQSILFNTYTSTIPYTGQVYANFENKYYIRSSPNTGSTGNDTIIRDQVFHNFFAYDDGTAEKSYYLNLFSSLPGKTALEFHLNHDDTLKGISIYFGRQVPTAYHKYFSVAVYKDLSNPNDPPIFQEDYLYPGYLAINHFYTYKFQNPIPLAKGTFYIGTIQPGFSNSDSLYFGLDANRVGGNHLYYNVLGFWESSTVSGALMMRPVFGPIFSSGVEEVVVVPEMKWTVSPGPVTTHLMFHYSAPQKATYEIYSVEGRCVKKDIVKAEEPVNVSDLMSGIYFVRLSVEGYISQPQKIIKL
jgi:hypothetical protein